MFIPTDINFVKKLIGQHLLGLCLLLSCSNSLFAQPLNYSPQCSISDLNGASILIGDFDTISLRFNILAADFPDLSSFQSICAVRVHFEHGNLGDLTMKLTSPNGITVSLIGPALPGITQSVDPFKVDHDVYFVSSASPDVAPDPNLSSPWSNILPTTWHLQSSYGGVYLPQSGDFVMDYNTGSALGIWELTIIDHFQNDVGEITGFEIEFCEDMGLVCDVCEASAGTITPMDTIICTNDNIDIAGIFTPSVSDPNIYSEEYFVYDEDDVLMLSGPSPDLSLLDSGTYYVHSFDILSTQYASGIGGLEMLSRGQLLDSVSALGGVLCMDISDDVLSVEISTPDTMRTDETLCFGKEILFGGVLLNTTGEYSMITAECDFIEILDLRASQLQASIISDTISTDCITGEVEFGGTIVNPSGPLSYQWSDINDTVIGTDSLFTFTTSGDFSFFVSDGICDTTILFTVEDPGANLSIDINADPPQLNCDQDSSDLIYTVNFPVSSVRWFRDGVEIATNVTLVKVGQEGTYEVEVIGDTGCNLTDDITITTDLDEPAAQITAPDLTCTESEITASFSTTDMIQEVTWISQGTVIGNASDVLINTAGSYELLLKGENACTTLIPFDVAADMDLLMIDDVPEGMVVLDCFNENLTINPLRDGSTIVEEYWIFGVDDTLPQADGINIVVSNANSYRYEVITNNGCKQSIRFDVLVDTIPPDFILVPDSITCATSRPETILSGLDSGIVVSFTGGNIVSETDSTVTVDEAGRVFFELLDTLNGCMVADSYDIIEDKTKPRVNIVGDSILTCENPEADLMAEIDGNAIADFFWIEPSGDTLDQQSIVASQEGSFFFEAIGTNGCDVREEKIIATNIDLPPLDVPSSVTVSCGDPVVSLSITNITNLDSINWVVDMDTIEGPQLDVRTLSNNVELLIVGDNGCSDATVIDILYDTLDPSFLLVADTLNCNNLAVSINPNTSLPNHTFRWAGQDIDDITSSEVSVAIPGAYGLNVIDTTNGCSHLEVIDVMSNYDMPMFIPLPIDTITCNSTSVNVSLSTPDANEVIWSTSDGRIEIGPTILASSSGQQIFTITGRNGCTISDSVAVFENLVSPRVTIDNEYVISCSEDQFILTPVILDPIRSLLWRYKSGTTASTSSQTISDDDLESLIVTGTNGCETQIAFNITISNDIPLADINIRDTLVCSGESIMVRTSPITLNSQRIIWFRDEVLFSQDDEDILVEQSGNYILQVLDTVSGCIDYDTVNVVINPMPLLEIEVNKMDETCLNEGDGFIQIANVQGGLGQVMITLDGEEIDLSEVNARLPGTYLVQIEDGLGCIIDTIVNIVEGGFIEVELGPDISVERGTNVTIDPQYNGDTPNEVMWFDNQGFISNSDDVLTFAAFFDNQINIEVSTDSGCQASDSVLVNVFVDIGKIEAYIPNIMSLNSDQDNDLFVLTLTPDITEVTDFSIYDRWGQQVMHLDRVLSGDVVAAWDGRFNGQRVESGVYVYSYSFLTVYDDIRRVRRGDITVID